VGRTYQVDVLILDLHVCNTRRQWRVIGHVILHLLIIAA
jgi:hypothetical protein